MRRLMTPFLAAMLTACAIDDGSGETGGAGGVQQDLSLDEDEAAFRGEVEKARTRIVNAKAELEASYAAGKSLVERANKMATDTADLLGPLVREVQAPMPEAPQELAAIIAPPPATDDDATEQPIGADTPNDTAED